MEFFKFPNVSVISGTFFFIITKFTTLNTDLVFDLKRCVQIEYTIYIQTLFLLYTAKKSDIIYLFSVDVIYMIIRISECNKRVSQFLYHKKHNLIKYLPKISP